MTACRLLIGILLLGACSAFAQTFTVSAELWDRPRTARSVLDQESIRLAVGAALAKPETQIVIHHGAGQEPLVQAEELRSWLAALAIDSRRTVLRADAAPGAPITLEISP